MDSENVYYNATVICSKSDVNSNDFHAMFEDNTSQNIVSNTGDYQFAIVRYSLEGANLPIWIPTITNGNTTTYSITLTASPSGSGKTFTSDETFLQYIPRNNVQMNDPIYYFVYNYEQFVEMVNNAFVSALANLQTKIANYTLKSNVPIMEYNGQSNLFNIYCDAQGFVKNTAGESMTITFNNELYNLLRTFYFDTKVNNFRQLIVQDKVSNVSVINGITYYIASQYQSSTSSCWSPIQSIIFSSDSLALKPEIIGSVSYIGNGSSLGAGNSNNTQMMITDFVLDLAKSSDYYSQMITYTPSLYRWIDLSAGPSLKNFRFSAWWLNKFNQDRYPIMLSNHGSLTMKVTFRSRQ
jgi:hypothetical protein